MTCKNKIEMKYGLPCQSLSAIVVFQALGEKEYEKFIRLYAQQVVMNRLSIRKSHELRQKLAQTRKQIDKKIEAEIPIMIEERTFEITP